MPVSDSERYETVTVPCWKIRDVSAAIIFFDSTTGDDLAAKLGSLPMHRTMIGTSTWNHRPFGTGDSTAVAPNPAPVVPDMTPPPVGVWSIKPASSSRDGP